MAGSTTHADAKRPAARRGWWRRVKWTVRGLFLTALFMVFIFGCDDKFYYPNNKTYDAPEDFGLSYEDVTFQTTDGLTLHGWFLTARGRPKGTVIHFHGNAGNIGAHVGLVAWLPPSGFNVLMFDYRGYGRSQGKVTRKGTILDGRAALDYVLTRKDVDKTRIFALGQSLGGAVATVVAAERTEIRAVVLDSTFSSYRRIAAEHLRRILRFDAPARFLAWSLISGDYEPIDVIAEIAPRPLLMFASGADQICFPELARELYDAASEPKEFILAPGASHMEVFISNLNDAQGRVLEFLESAP